jgi:hypothetical protein
VRTRKESERTRGTHFLDSPDRRTGEDTERKRASEGHSLPGEHRPTDKSGHEKQANERARATHELEIPDRRPVRTRKESERTRGTHQLGSAGRRPNEDTERRRASERHSLAGTQTDGQVRTREKSERAIEGHSLAGERGPTHRWEHGKKVGGRTMGAWHSNSGYCCPMSIEGLTQY